jgi:hypothetical protein
MIVVLHHMCMLHWLQEVFKSDFYIDLQEVFKSDFYTSIQLTQVIGKCYVMYVKEYFKSKPEVRKVFFRNSDLQIVVINFYT